MKILWWKEPEDKTAESIMEEVAVNAILSKSYPTKKTIGYFWEEFVKEEDKIILRDLKSGHQFKNKDMRFVCAD